MPRLGDKVSWEPNRTPWVRRPEVLLCNNTVKPMHGVVPRLILGKEWWDKTRNEAYQSTRWHCVACGVYKKDAIERPFLEGHELYDIDYRKGRQTYIETVPLCHYCHCFIHDGRLRALVDKGEEPLEKLNSVLTYGTQVLKEAGLKKRPISAGRHVAKWGDWRLVLFGKEYPPVYKDFEEWKKAYGYFGDDST